MKDFDLRKYLSENRLLKEDEKDDLKKSYDKGVSSFRSDLSKYISGYNSENFIYDLFGTGNHSGNVYGGHYTANIKNANGKWYSFNDTLINEISEEKVITAHTYCLFYRKKNKD